MLLAELEKKNFMPSQHNFDCKGGFQISPLNLWFLQNLLHGFQAIFGYLAGNTSLDFQVMAFALRRYPRLSEFGLIIRTQFPPWELGGEWNTTITITEPITILEKKMSLRYQRSGIIKLSKTH